MKTNAAVLWRQGDPWSVEEIELDPPQTGEVRVRIAAAGLCHSDEHVRCADGVSYLPLIGGHEGAGVIEEVGPGVTELAVGDHVVFSFIPACGRCKWCSTGRANLCDYGRFLMQGGAIAGGFRAHARTADLGMMTMVGAFAEQTVVHETSIVKIDSDIPLPQAALLGCAVPTGWGSSVNIGRVRPGDTVAVVGVGGIGANAVQGARMAGASTIIAVDPAEFKRSQAKIFGATHAASSMSEAKELISALTNGEMASVAVCSIGVPQGSMMQEFTDLVSKGGRAVLTGVASGSDNTVTLGLQAFAMYEKSFLGTVYGGCSPRADIPRFVELYRNGQLKLDELITNTYSLDQINEGYADMLSNKNIRGVIVF